MPAQSPATPGVPPVPSSSEATPSPYAPVKSKGAMDSSRFIVVFGTKGGVGKTVVATNLAASLSQRTKNPVCLIDLDTMAVGDVSKMLNISTTRSIIDLMPALRRASSDSHASELIHDGAVHELMTDPTQAIRESLARSPIPFEGLMSVHTSGVHVLSCLSNPRQVNQLDPKALPVLFQALKSRYEYIVVDGGKMFTEPLIAAFDAANLILLVASPDVIALYQTKWSLGMLESLLFPSSMVKAVLNRAESRGGVDTKDVRVVIPCEVIGEIPSDGHVVGTSVNRGVPIVTAFGGTKVAAAFLQLADQLISRRDFYVAQKDIPRHQRPKDAVSSSPTQGQGGMWASRLYGAEDGGQVTEEVVDEIVLLKRRIHERLVEELDLKKLDLGSMVHSAQLTELRQKTERVIANLLAREIGGIAPSREVRARLVKEIADEALGLGPLEELLVDPEITDILVNNKDQIYVERHGKLELTTRKFVSNDLVRAVIERIVAPLGRRIDESSPMVDARLPDGSRVNAVIPPLSIKGPALSIRKFARIRYSQDDLVTFGSISQPMMLFIRACTIVKKNLIISGGTGSGKTTLLNIVSSSIPVGERIITIEDAAELQLAQTHWVSLEARPTNVEGKGQVTIRDLFRNALRMRPDRIIVGECRGAETLDMLQAMNTGHHGSITTIHANSPRDAISRLDSMVLMSNIELPLRAIREMVASAINVIIHTGRLSDGTRKILAVTEITGLGGDADIQFQDIFVFKQTGVAADGAVLGEFSATGKIPTFLDELKVKGIGLDESVFTAEPSSHVEEPPALPTPEASILKPPR